jgi:hypothetical protein
VEALTTEGDTFERESKVMAVFIDNAKTYVQLSAGALLLTVTFLHEILGIPKENKKTNSQRIVGWSLLGGASWWQSFLGHFISIMQQNFWSGNQVFREVTTAGHGS